MTDTLNPHAFPLGDPTHGGYDGMSLRDWFAGQALVGTLADREVPGEPVAVASYAYRIADAMLAERAKVQP